MITLFLKDLEKRFSSYKPYRTIVERGLRNAGLSVSGVEESFLPLLLNLLRRDLPAKRILVVVSGDKQAENLSESLKSIRNDVHYLPFWGTAPYRPVSPQSNVFGARLAFLRELSTAREGLFIVSLRSIAAPVPGPEEFRASFLTLTKNAGFDPTAVEEKLTAMGYERVPKVTVEGEFALRGEVLDIFPPGEAEAFRVLFGFNEIEELRRFDPIDQATTSKADSLIVSPVREVRWDAEHIGRLRAAFRELGRDEAAADVVGALENDGRLEGEELYYPLAYASPSSVLDYLGPNDTLIEFEKERIRNGFRALEKEVQDTYRSELKRRRSLPPPRFQIQDVPSLLDARPGRLVFTSLVSGAAFSAYSSAGTGSKATADPNAPLAVSFPCEASRSFFGNVQYLKEEFKNLIDQGYKITVFSESEAQAKRIEYLLREFSIPVISWSISSGFSLPELKILVVQENEIFGRKRRIPKSVHTAKSRAIDTFVDLAPGDLVVHLNYGIGRFAGIQRIKAGGNERDYIELEYAAEERLFIPIEQVNLIQKYIGQDREGVRLDHIGGKSWSARKEKVRKSVEEMAERLLVLYSQRKVALGHAFPRDTDWQTDFEAEFPYEETPDQITCIEDVKADMEKPVPMDRMVCGDVGYGKTEVAMRAAFKAVMDGKQVAYLAPTTILVEQQFENFADRLTRFPVKSAMLSRFVPKSKQKDVVSGLAAGTVDLVIGTHRLLQKDIKFKNLGLLVIDEEQRFGVKDKERLKELRHNVDCLVLTATPIPRTLHMSLMKLRDMSLLTTPPQNRHPIETYIEEFREERLAEAIRREMERGGQIFYLHNRVETLEAAVRYVSRLVPEAMVESAHGQMNSEELEDIMHRFMHHGFQVLVSTTIIENGLDIPNVNTIIIDRADTFGVSQLYQLRGRVGRSDRQAYAYLFYPPDRALTEIAMKRLTIISEHSELGAGFKIAMKDLEIRGAGNLLGREQHGDINSIGFDLYLKLLDEAVTRLSDSKKEPVEEVYLELEYSGYIPDDYIREPVEKMELYKKIVAIDLREELDRLCDEVQDRFGPPPPEVLSLFSLSEIRILCRSLSVSKIVERDGYVSVEFTKVAKIAADKVVRLIKESAGAVQLDPKRPNVLRFKTEKIGLKEKSEFIRDRLLRLVG